MGITGEIAKRDSEAVTTVERIEPPASPQAVSFLAVIARAASDPNVNIEKMQALMDMQFKIEERDAKAAFNQAFHEMEPELPRIKKNGDVEYKGQKAFSFARWEDIDQSIRPILRRFGFSLSFDTEPRIKEGGGLIVTGTLLHVSGHSRSASMDLPLDASGGKNNLQGGGSTFSYGKRYTTTMLLNLTFEGQDDDGVRGGTVYISDDQVKQLLDLIKEVKADTVQFLRFLGVQTLTDIETKHFPSAINALMKKKSQMGERQ